MAVQVHLQVLVLNLKNTFQVLIKSGHIGYSGKVVDAEAYIEEEIDAQTKKMTRKVWDILN